MDIQKVTSLQPELVIAVTSRALFDLNESHGIYEQKGEQEYAHYQIGNESVPLQPGVAFPLVKKLLALNTQGSGKLVEVVLLSRNSADTGLRVFNSINHYSLAIQRAAFTRGRSPYAYARAFGTHLFLSANRDDVQLALEAGMAAATIVPSVTAESPDGPLRIAFDGDAVLFSDEAEKVFMESGLAVFNSREQANSYIPLPGGPFKPFLNVLHAIQAMYHSNESPIRTALITARSAPAHERVIRTLRSWDIRIDEALFLGGLDKGRFLESFGADIFFDDQRRNCDSAAAFVPTGHVPYGIKNASNASGDVGAASISTAAKLINNALHI